MGTVLALLTGAATGIFTGLSWGALAFAVVTIMQLVNVILGAILYVAGWIFDWSLKLSTTFDSSALDIVDMGWTLSLQFANMFFIVILLAIAIGTILQLGSINKKLLPTLLLVALLINFSMVIGGIVIDASNVFALYFSDTIQSAGDPSEMLMTAFLASSADKIKNDSTNGMLAKLGDIAGNFVDLFLMSFYEAFTKIVAIFVFIAGAVYMIQRAFWLWLLLMISPLAWIALAIPGQQQYFKKWWDKFIKWCLFAPVFLFFIYLSLIISTKAANLSVSNDTLDSIFNPATIIQLVLVAFLMFFGIAAANGLGVAGSNFVIDWGKGQKDKFASTLKALRSKGPVEKLLGGVGEKTAEWTARGIAAVPRAGRLAGYEKEVVSARIKKEKEKEREKEIAQEAEKLENKGTWELHSMIDDIKKGTGTSSIQKAAAVKILLSRGEEATAGLSEIELGYMRQAEVATKSTLDRKDNIIIPYAISFKARKEEVDKNLKNIELAGSKYEKEDINRLYSIYQGALHTGRTSPRTASILTALENRIDEIIPIILPGATVQQINAAKSKMKSNIKSAKNAASKGKTRTAYLP